MRSWSKLIKLSLSYSNIRTSRCINGWTRTTSGPMRWRSASRPRKREYYKRSRRNLNDLSKLLDEFQEAFEEEVRVRKAREEVILRQMDQHERHITQNFDVEYEARVARVKEIQEELVACMKSSGGGRRAGSGVSRRSRQDPSLIDAEVSQRERQDDNIMRALDQYTDKMRASLEIVNSTNGPSCVFRDGVRFLLERGDGVLARHAAAASRAAPRAHSIPSKWRTRRARALVHVTIKINGRRAAF